MSADQIWPVLLGLSALLNAILLLRKPISSLLHRNDEVSEDEIMAMVEEGEESGTIEANEKEMIENIFEFNNMTAEDVMVHRIDMVSLSLFCTCLLHFSARFAVPTCRRVKIVL